MRMASVSSNVKRRTPQQERASRRVTALLETAATVFAEVGYEAATMTAIAERSGASIGCMYQYFPDKAALANALHSQHGEEIGQHWAPLIQSAKELTIPQFVDSLIERMVEFVKARPAYLPLLAAPIKLTRNPVARQKLRDQFAEAFIKKNPALSKEKALLAANVVLQILKGMVTLYAEASTKGRTDVIAEFKQVLLSYLDKLLRPEATDDAH